MPCPSHPTTPFLLATLLLGSAALPVQSAQVKVTIENLAPARGTLLTPFWVGFHDGSFDLYDAGAPASAALERLAEDGNPGPLATAFAGSGAGSVEGTVTSQGPIPPFGPGTSGSMVFSLDPLAPGSRYLSYASMVIPSNDAFVANGDPLAFPIFGPGGGFLGADFLVVGTMVRDAGTEVNDETPAHTAFFGQAAPDTGVPEFGTIGLHPGFLPSGSGGILDGSFLGYSFADADFTAPGYVLARITVTAIPEPSTLIGGAILGALVGGATWFRRRTVRA